MRKSFVNILKSLIIWQSLKLNLFKDEKAKFIQLHTMNVRKNLKIHDNSCKYSNLIISQLYLYLIF